MRYKEFYRWRHKKPDTCDNTAKIQMWNIWKPRIEEEFYTGKKRKNARSDVQKVSLHHNTRNECRMNTGFLKQCFKIS